MTRQQFPRTLSAGAIGFSVRRAQPAAQTFTYKTAGCEIRADVYGASEGARKPALLWMHGGALILGNRTGLMRPLHAGTKQDRQQQEELFYAREQAEAPGHSFYQWLNQVPRLVIS